MNDPNLVITNEQMQHMRENLEWVVRRAGSTITALRSNREGAIDVDADNVHDNIGEARRTMGDGQRSREGIDIGAANEEERRVRMRHDDHSVRPDEELLAESDNSVSSIDSIMGVPVGRHSTAGRTHTAGQNGTAGRTTGRGATGRGATRRGGSRSTTGRGAAGRGATGRGATGRGVTTTGRDAVGISFIDAAASAASSNPANVDATDDVFADVSMRRPLGSFVNATNIRDASRAEAIINILILAENHDGGLAGTLAYGHRTGWFCDNVSMLFSSDGPLAQFTITQPLLLMRHFGNAEKLAQRILNRNHSNEQSGAGQEVVPAWVQQFGRLFEAQSNNPSVSAQAELTRDERRMIATSIMGQQAPLGHHDTTLPAQIRTETESNIGNRQLHQVVGRFEA